MQKTSPFFLRHVPFPQGPNGQGPCLTPDLPCARETREGANTYALPTSTRLRRSTGRVRKSRGAASAFPCPVCVVSCPRSQTRLFSVVTEGAEVSGAPSLYRGQPGPIPPACLTSPSLSSCFYRLYFCLRNCGFISTLLSHCLPLHPDHTCPGRKSDCGLCGRCAGSLVARGPTRGAGRRGGRSCSCPNPPKLPEQAERQSW